MINIAISSVLLSWAILFGGNAFGQDTIVWALPISSFSVEVASSIQLDGEENVYLIDEDKTKIYKYLAAYQYDSALSVGGKSHREEGFLEIASLDISNRQTGYILDEGRQRISLIHPNLRVLQDLSLTSVSASSRIDAPQDILMGDMAANSAGELFLLNLLDNQIYVLSAQGEWTLTFGGTDYGAGAILEPTSIELSPDNFLYVAEPEYNRIQVFDIFGTFRYTLTIEISHSWKSFQVQGQILFIKGEKAVTFVDLRTQNQVSYPFPMAGIIDLYWGQQGVYFLTENQVHLYPLPNRD